MSQTWSGEFSCVQCKATREATGHLQVSDEGTTMTKRPCPECGTTLNRILGRA